jgi:hypothetical protein
MFRDGRDAPSIELNQQRGCSLAVRQPAAGLESAVAVFDSAFAFGVLVEFVEHALLLFFLRRSITARLRLTL